MQQWPRWIHITIFDCLKVMNLRSSLIPPLLYIPLRPYRLAVGKTLAPAGPEIAVARMHTSLDRALVLNADTAHQDRGGWGGAPRSKVLTLAEEGFSSG